MDNQNPVQNPNLVPPPVVPTAPEQPFEPKPKLSKWILVAIVVVVLIIASGTAYFLNKNSIKTAKTLPSPTPIAIINTTPTPDPKANWKTYINSKYGYSFKYPTDVQIVRNENSDCILSTCAAIDLSIPSVTLYPAGGYIQKGFNLTVDIYTPTIDAYKVEFENVKSSGKIAEGSGEKTIGEFLNLPSIITNYNDSKIIRFMKDGYLYELYFTTKLKSVTDIVSTFKFTDQTSQTVATPTPDPTANWKTYTSICGFTVKLPQNWNAAAYLVSGTENSCGRITDPNFKTYLNSDKRDGFYIFLDRKKIGSIYMTTQINDIESYLLSQEKIMTPQATINNRDDKTIGKFAGTEYDTVGMGGERQFVFINNGYVYTASWPLELTTTNRATIDKIINSISFN